MVGTLRWIELSVILVMLQINIDIMLIYAGRVMTGSHTQVIWGHT